jgi:hypothetical protein
MMFGKDVDGRDKRGDDVQTKLRHREPLSGVAIQKIFHWIASLASPPRNDGVLCLVSDALLPSG